ncbi:MAG: transcription elongation factor GreB [Pseudomonadota bacterium]
MGRYRPPPPPRSKYITQAGKDKLQAELDYLWSDKRPKVTKAVQEAAAQGDRSENAEYIYGKKQLREIDSRVRFLQKRLGEVTAVAEAPADKTRVFFGAWVILEDEQGETTKYRIVGPDEFDHAPGFISIDAPLAKALLKKSLDDEVIVRTPAGETVYSIIGIHYE